MTPKLFVMFARYAMIAVVSLVCVVHAQEPATPQTGSVGESSSKPDLFKPADGSEESQTSPGFGQEIRQIGGASILSAQPGFLRVGPFYVSSIEGVGSHINFRDAGRDNRSSGLIRSHMFFDKSFQQSRITLQYQPKIAFYPEGVHADFLNQRIGFASEFALTQRFKLTVIDNFSFIDDREQALEAGLSADPRTNYLSQNHLLGREGRYVVNDLRLSAGYLLGARTQIKIDPTIGYGYSSHTAAGERGMRLGGTVSLHRQLRPTTTVGVYYGFHRNAFQRQFSDSNYHNMGLTYATNLTPNWSVQLTAGGVNMDDGLGRHWTAEGGIQTIRKFRSSSLSLAYSRNSAFYTNLKPGFADHGDIMYSRSFGQRLAASLGIGAYREAWSLRDSEYRYVSSNVSYRLIPSVNWFATYTYRKQKGSSSELLLGAHDTFVTGFQWSPGGRR